MICLRATFAASSDNSDQAFEDLKTAINYDEAGIPYAYDENNNPLNQKQSYEYIVAEVRRIVDQMTTPLSRLQAMSQESDQDWMDLLGDEFKDLDLDKAVFTTAGGDEKFKAKLVEELTKNLHKPQMWKETVQSKDDPLKLGD